MVTIVKNQRVCDLTRILSDHNAVIAEECVIRMVFIAGKEYNVRSEFLCYEKDLDSASKTTLSR